MIPIEKLKGEQLSSVAFVQDYLQLHFDGPLMSVFSPLMVSAEGKNEMSGDSEFRNAICAQVSKVVAEIEFKDQAYLKLFFVDQSTTSISLVPSDYTGPEALYFHGYDETLVI